MVKDQLIYLPKQVPILLVCLGWKAGCDVDCSILLSDREGNQFDIASYMQKVTKCGSVRHGGDNYTGNKDGDDEFIKIWMNGVSLNC